MDFFKSGLITARLKSGGTTDLARDAFVIVVISGTSSDEHCFSSHVGIGSSSQVLQGATATSRSTLCCIAGRCELSDILRRAMTMRRLTS